MGQLLDICSDLLLTFSQTNFLYINKKKLGGCEQKCQFLPPCALGYEIQQTIFFVIYEKDKGGEVGGLVDTLDPKLNPEKRRKKKITPYRVTRKYKRKRTPHGVQRDLCLIRQKQFL